MSPRGRTLSRKGVEMSMTMIIVIVIGLVLLAVIIYLVVRNSGGFNSSISSCREKGGTCKSSCDPGESGSSFFTNGCESGSLCCIPETSLLGNGNK